MKPDTSREDFEVTLKFKGVYYYIEAKVKEHGVTTDYCKDTGTFEVWDEPVFYKPEFYHSDEGYEIEDPSDELHKEAMDLLTETYWNWVLY